MKKKLLILFFLSFPLYAQYTPADYELVQTTYSRKFNPEIIKKYLNSARSENVKAALLSLSHSQDTSVVKDITELSYSGYGDYIAFALGHIGPCRSSISYLLDRTAGNTEGRFEEAAFDALGRIGGKEDFELVLERYLKGSRQDFNGISLAAANFNSRGINSADGKDIRILSGELKDTELPVRRRIHAAFALSRAGASKDSQEDILKVLQEKSSSEENVILRQYSLSALRKMKSFQGSFTLLKALVSDQDWRIRTEAAKAVCYYNFRTEDELRYFLQLLEDKNPNVSRQAAISLREINLSGSMADFLKDELKKRLTSLSDASASGPSYTPNTMGEIFLSYSRLDHKSAFDVYSQAQDKIGIMFFYRLLAENFSDPAKNLEFLSRPNETADNAAELERLNALLALQAHLSGERMLDSILLSSISSGFAAAVSVTADGIDTLFIQRHENELKKIIKRQTDIHLDDPQFTESNISLANLAGKISPGFRLEVLNSMKRAALYSMSSFAFRELGKDAKTEKDMKNFGHFWKNSFRFKTAAIKTNKGSFTIKLNPGMSPVSAGSFCYLASKGFFDGIVFHRVVPDFVIQAGDPEGTGWGGPGYEIVSEFSPLPFERSYVGMASAGKDTEGSQWFVMHSYFPHLNGRYSNFGKVIKGMEVVDTIDQGDKILKVEFR